MPRKTSQRSAAIAEAKNEGGAPRRSGRASTKQETTTTTTTKEASRSRRSSTAAQTAASVADSRTPRAKGSSRRESTSPSDSRSRATRRSTGRVNYKESDGEEEVQNTKLDENFESGEDAEESESDEKSKTRGRSRSAKAPAKSTAKSKGASRSRRGRPSKDKEEEEGEEKETFDVSDDSNEPKEVPVKKGRAAKEKEPAKPTRNRRQRAEVTEVKSKAATEEKSRGTRRSGRGSTNKEESSKKRPTRGVQAKRYAEDDDDEIEEIDDSKAEEEETMETKETEGRKRKRGASPEEANKRLKDDGEEHEEEKPKEEEEKEEKDINEEIKESTDEKKAVEEPMEIDTTDSAEVPETEKKNEEVKEEKSIELKVEEKVDGAKEELVEDKMEQESVEEKMDQEETVPASKEQEIIADKQDSKESPKKVENIQSSVPDSGKKIEPPSSEMDSSHKVETVDKVKEVDTTVDEIEIDPPKVEKTPEPASQPAEQKSEKDNLPPMMHEKSPEKISDKKVEPALDATLKANSETPKIENAAQDVKNTSPVEVTTVPSVTPPVPVTPPKESVSDMTLNGAEQSNTTQHSTKEVHNVSTPNANFDNADNNTPKANGAHNDVQHTNSPIKDQYYLLPGRKYVINSKLNENVRQSVKNNMFGFVSFNLGTPDSDAYLQKDKLLNELGKLDAHVICLQQVAKPFYNAVLEPSLDALGFKSIFSQPQDSLKGMATFYKSSLFRLSGKSDISLRQLIEKEVETSPLDSEQKAAVKSHIRRCGSVLFTHFSTVIGTQTITVANVQIPRSDFSSHALQISCLAQEVIRINGGTNKPLLLGGEFNIAENDASYQLLRDGYLSNDMIEELQQRKDVVLPDNKHDSLLNLLWKSFQHPSSNLCSCYHSVLDHEFIIPELKTASPDLLWFSSDSLHTVGVLDVVSDKTGDHHLSLKADIAFSI